MAIQSANLPDFATLDQFRGLNQQGRRGSIDEQEEWWNENLFAIAPGNLRSLWGPSAPIYTAPSGTTILRIFFGFYGNQTPQFGAPPPGAMGWMFLSDGTIDELDLFSGALTGLRSQGAIWTPIGPQWWASAKVWRPQFYGSSAGQQGGVLFGSPAGLYAWDGTTIWRPGDTAPDWLTDLAETDPSATPPPMPQGLPGIYSMEVYASRLWVAGKDVISFSAPSNGADFSTASGGGSFGYFGDRLVYSWMDLCASAGYLYLVGDSSVDAINNVSLAGTAGSLTAPLTTNFNYSNTDPQVGQRFPRPVGRIGRDLALFNGAGIWLMQGATADPIGDKVTNLWNTLDTSLYVPTFAPATIFGKRVLLLNGRFTDPWGRTRSLMLAWLKGAQGEGRWSVASQRYELTQIGTYEQDSTLIPFGTDGSSLFRLFAQPDPTLKKKFSTKALRGVNQSNLVIRNVKRAYCEFEDNDGRGVSLNATVSTFGGVPGGQQTGGFEIPPGGVRGLEGLPLQGAGITVAADIESISPDFTIERVHIAVEDRTLFGA